MLSASFSSTFHPVVLNFFGKLQVELQVCGRLSDEINAASLEKKKATISVICLLNIHIFVKTKEILPVP